MQPALLYLPEKKNKHYLVLDLYKVSTMLNRAHALRRQAERAARKDNFDEAVKYHIEAADLLHQLLENILEEKFAESIRLQAQLHEKEKTLLRNQKKKAEKTYQESIIRNMSDKEVGRTSKRLDKLQPCDETVGAKGSRDFIAVPSDYLVWGPFIRFVSIILTELVITDYY